MRLSEYSLECDHCGSETRVTVINKKRQEPEYCPLCGYESYSELIDEEEDSDD